MAKQRRKERAFTAELVNRTGGRCQRCGQLPDWRGLSKHEKVKRSQGGDPLDPNNCEILCGRCHSKEHGIKEA